MERHELLDILKSEKAFLEGGGYQRSERTPWKAPLIFEDSPTCLNYQLGARPNPCNKCALMRFVPLRRRSARVPCRYISLNAAGETLDGLYRYASPQELEQALTGWLAEAIRKLEDEVAREQKGKPPSAAHAPDAGGAKLRQD